MTEITQEKYWSLNKNFDRLVQKITNLNENHENFAVCRDFVMSNFLCQKHLDVNSQEVARKIDRFYEKFQLSCEDKKAKRFKFLTDKLMAAFDRRFITQREAGYGALSLILSLSQSGKSETDTIHPESGKFNKLFDWSSYLSEDNLKICPFSDSDSDLELSDSEDASSIIDTVSIPPPRDDSGLGISPDGALLETEDRVSFDLECVSHVTLGNDLRNPDTFYAYWSPKHQKGFGSTPYQMPNFDFTKIWSECLANEDLCHLIDRKVMVHEQNVIKEVLWMFSGVKRLFAFNWDGQKFAPNPQIHLSNLTSNTLCVSLTEFCSYATRLSLLEEKSAAAAVGDSGCTTRRAHGRAMEDECRKIGDSVRQLDALLRKREEVLTLLKLKEKMKPIFCDIDTVFQMYSEVTVAVSGVEENFLAASHLLHTLWTMMQHNSILKDSIRSMSIILHVFLKSCRPYVTFWENLSVLGSLSDHHSEFLIKQEEVDPKSEGFWDKSVSLRPLPRDLEDFFLNSLLGDMACAGKSLRAMNEICARSRREPHTMRWKKGKLFQKFIDELNLAIAKPGSASQEKNLAIDDKDPFFDEEKSGGKYEEFFRPGINPVYKNMCLDEPYDLSDEIKLDPYWSIDNIELLDARDAIPSVKRSLLSCNALTYTVCPALVRSLHDEHKIVEHFDIMMKYFLMGSGDVMFNFYTEIFNRVMANESWADVSFLHSALQNAISESCTISEKIHISFDAQHPDINPTLSLTQLNGLQLVYEVEWPVTILLSSSAQNEYSQIFTYLLQIKCAKYLLDQLYSTALCERASTRLARVLLRSTLPREQITHGMRILRIRLLHFVNGLHGYVMARVDTLGAEFLEALHGCDSVDEMLQLHARYLQTLRERCLLDRRLTYLREHVLQVLHLCHRLQRVWAAGIECVSVDELLEMEQQFSKSCNFLSCCFKTPLRRGTSLQLGILANSMLSSSHVMHVFGENK